MRWEVSGEQEGPYAGERERERENLSEGGAGGEGRKEDDIY
jgi:hypothetical protein